MARKFEPLLTRWENWAESMRNSKGNLDFGEIDPSKTPDEQRDDNAVAVEVEEMIKDMRLLATELGKYFDIYVEDEIKTGIEDAMSDEESFQKMVALLLAEGKLEGINAVTEESTDTPDDSEDATGDADYSDEELEELSQLEEQELNEDLDEMAQMDDDDEDSIYN